jgi:hypothetical protein
MYRSALGLITLRRQLAERHARIYRLWVTARNAYRRLHAAPVQNLAALRAARSARPRTCGAAARPQGAVGLKSRAS